MSTESAIVASLSVPLRSSKLDRNFPDSVSRKHGGQNLLLCYQCGSCTGGCPVGKIMNSYNPRQIIHMTLMGLKNDVLTSDLIWLCASCYTCQERCPQEVEIADLMFALRNMAVEEGHVPRAMIDQASMLLDNGRIVPFTSLVERSRQTLGLSKIPNASPDVVKKIAMATGFDKLIVKLKETTKEATTT